MIKNKEAESIVDPIGYVSQYWKVSGAEYF